MRIEYNTMQYDKIYIIYVFGFVRIVFFRSMILRLEISMPFLRK